MATSACDGLRAAIAIPDAQCPRTVYLKEVRINGFKSFADSTAFELNPGMTAIVGPNGCGKSNVADAIRWVLGEQSSKSLRAGSMQDVIFQGTTQRKPMNLCEVSLLFTDCEEQLGTAYNQVEISRRVTRDGGSDYFLNGKSCRLKDIHRLFLDTGIGQVSYSFMLQGQIDRVLSSNPAERRGIFEEAAGISRYKAQRREALNKLALVDANLARVTDVIEEVSRQIASLKRQAGKALRYKRIRHRLTHLELAVAARRHQVLDDEIRRLSGDADTVRGRVTAIRARLAGLQSDLDERRTARDERFERMQSAQQTVYDLRAQKEQAESKASFAGVRITDLEERIQAIRAELTNLRQERDELAQRLAGESRSRQEQLELFGSSDEVFKSKSGELVEVQNLLDAAEAAHHNARQELLVSEGKITRLRANCTTLEVDLKTYQVRHANLTEELQTLAEEHSILEDERERLQGAHSAREIDCKQSEEVVANLRATGEDLRRQFREKQEEIQKSDRTTAGIAAKSALLEELQAKFEGFSEGAKALLQGKLSDVLGTDEPIALARAIRIDDSRWIAASEALMGAALDGVVLQNREQLLPVASRLREASLGRACLPFCSPDRKSPSQAHPLPDFLIPASDAIRAEDQRIAEILPKLLADCYFTEDLGAFVAFWEANTAFRFVLVATTNGDLLDGRGMLFAGTSKSKKDIGVLQRSNEIKRLKREHAEGLRAHDRLKGEATQIQTHLDAAEKRLEDARSRQMENAQEFSTLEAQLKANASAIDHNGRRTRERQRELDALEAGKVDSTKRLERAQSELLQCEEAISSGRQAVADAEVKVAHFRDERERRRERFNEIRLEISEKKQRLASLDRGLEQLSQQSHEIDRRTTQRSQEIDTITEQIANLRAESAEQTELAQRLETTLRATMETLDGDRAALKDIDSQIREGEANLSKERLASEHDTENLNQLEVRLARLRAEHEHLLNEILREHGVNIPDIDWRRSLWDAGDELPERIRVEIEDELPDEEPESARRPDPTNEDLARLDTVDWDDATAEVNSLRGRLNAMGPVNLLAIAEYQELKERHGFLKTQSDDLWNSKNRLVAAIDDINLTSRELFERTFEQIRKNFAFTFESLFGGGEANLQLVDTEDVLESGIEITARPPGTRLSHLGLLSGGQKTMTAVALLFAIYMVKPSPFCVLDEIDAPLDDANIGRFCEMLKGFLTYSQFLIITHNKRTISEANTIYGVTMQERGISKVLSMRFEKAAQHAAAAPPTGSQTALETSI